MGHFYPMREDLTGQEGVSLVLNDDGTVSKSSIKNSKKVIGFLGEIVSGKDSITNTEHQQVAWVISIGDSYHWKKTASVDNDGNATTTEIKNVNGVKVCNEGGDIEIGDLLVTSSREGYFMKQSDDIIRNYTAAKAGQNVVFGTDVERSEIYCIMICG
jgi:hypothetical protein